MSSLPTPNYIIIQDISLGRGAWSDKILKAGSFVRPIDVRYVPKHVLEQHVYYNPNFEIFCYTRYGIVPIAKNLMRIT